MKLVAQKHTKWFPRLMDYFHSIHYHMLVGFSQRDAFPYSLTQSPTKTSFNIMTQLESNTLQKCFNKTINFSQTSLTPYSRVLHHSIYVA